MLSQWDPNLAYTHMLQVTGMGHHCMCWLLSLLWGLQAGKQLHLA